MKTGVRLMAAVTAVAGILLSAAHPAEARWSSNGGSHGSSSSRSKSGKTYIEKKCKTDACFNKHPKGKYFVALPKKN